MGAVLKKKKPLILFVLVFIVLNAGLYQPVYANDSPEPDLTSEAFILMDSSTGKILYEENSRKPMYPASITKILTAIIAIETHGLNELVTVSSKAVEADGTRVYLLEGEQMTLAQLLQGLMVSSGNDAAIAIAEHIDGSVAAFAERMNRFAEKRIGVTTSNFTNPHGLFEEEHITTALDMAKISAYAMKNKAFRELVSTEYVDWVGEGWETQLYNHHPLLRNQEHVIGIKNGYVQPSGYTLSTAAKIGSTELITVTLNSPSRYNAEKDTLALLEYGFDNYETKWIDFAGEPLLANFIYPDAAPVTVKKGEPMHYNISEQGFVTIYNDEKHTLNVIELEERQRINLPKYVFLLEPEANHAEKNENGFFSWLDWFIITGFHFL